MKPFRTVKTFLVFVFIVFSGLTSVFAYRIEVTVSGHPGGLLYLGAHYGPEFLVIDTVQTNDKGYAVFEGKSTLPQGVYFIVIPPKTRFDFLLLDDQQFSMTTNLNNLVADLKMSGTDKPDLFFDLQRDIASINLASSQLDIKKQYFKNSGQAMPEDIKREEDSLKNRRIIVYKYYKSIAGNSYLSKILDLMLPPEFPTYVLQWQTEDPAKYYYYYKDHYFDAVDFTDERLLRTPEFIFHRMLQEYCKFFLSTRVDSIENVYKDVDALITKASANIEFEKYIVSYLVDHYETPSVIGMDAVFVYLADNYFINKKLTWADDKAVSLIKERRDEMQYNLLGMQAQNLKLKKLDGDYINTNEISTKYLILWFWEPGCSLCDELTPVLHSKYEEIRKMGSELIAINIQRNKSEWEKYITDNKLYWINAWDPDGVCEFYKYYGTNRTPRLFILDSQKRIVAKDVKPVDIVRYLQYLDTKK